MRYRAGVPTSSFLLRFPPVAVVATTLGSGFVEMIFSLSEIQNPNSFFLLTSAFILQINAPRSPRNGLTKVLPNVTKSPCFTPPVATHLLGSEKSTASPSWTLQAGPRKRRESRFESRAPRRRSRFHPSTFILHPFLKPAPSFSEPPARNSCSPSCNEFSRADTRHLPRGHPCLARLPRFDRRSEGPDSVRADFRSPRGQFRTHPPLLGHRPWNPAETTDARLGGIRWWNWWPPIFGANSREPQGFQPKMSGGCANSTLCTRNPNFSHNS